MNPQTLLDEFSAVANAPCGIEQIKQLIMFTALKGQLTKQKEELPLDFEDKLELKRSDYLLKINKKKKLLHYGQPLLHEFEIPNNWIWKRVGELCDLQTGATPSRQKQEYFGGSIRWLVSGDINKGEIFECDGRITEKGMDNSNCKILPKNSVLIALNGQGKTRATVAILRVAAACNQSLVAMIPYSQEFILPEYLYLSLKMRYLEIRDITGQKQRRGLNMGLVSELSVPLPPLEEQKRIVAKVDQLMALCDQFEGQQQKRSKLLKDTRVSALAALADSQGKDEIATAWKRVEENLSMLFEAPEDVEDLKKCVLQNAVMGKLVPQDSNDESASILLKKIAKEKAELVRKKEIKKQKPLPKIREDEKPFDIPEGWEWCRLGTTSLLITSGSRGWAKYYSNNGAAFIRMGNLSKNSFEMRLDNIQRVLPPKNSEGNRTSLKAKDLLISITGDVGMLGLIPEGFGEAYINQHTAVMRSSSYLHYLYVPFFCLSPMAIGQFSAPQRGIKNSFRLSDICEMIFPLPPIEEQKRIVKKVQALLALCDTLQKQLEKSRKIAEQFARAVVENITGITTEKKEKMKAPKTKLVTRLKLVKKPGNIDNAPLSAILARNKDELSAKALWSNSGLSIDEFYQQLKVEMTNGWIAEPEKAVMKELEAN